jgi:hypothetical protein
MRLAHLTIAFFFLGTAFAKPIYPLRGSDAINLSKRMNDPAEASTSVGQPTSITGDATRGRSNTRKGSGGGRKRPAGDLPEGDTGASRSRSRLGREDLATRTELLAALRNIQQANYAGRGSNSLAVYRIQGMVKGHPAVVKIINRATASQEVVNGIPGEVRNLRQVGQLLGWGRRTTPQLDYILMINMGGPLSSTDLDPEADKDLILQMRHTALQEYQTQHHLTHVDRDGVDNYVWDLVAPDSANKADRWKCHVIDWAGATRTNAAGAIYKDDPPRYSVPNEKRIYAPLVSPASSQHGGSTTPPSGGEPAVQHTGATGTRGSRRLAGQAPSPPPA